MDKIERRICWYSTALIVLLTNTPKLLALRPNGIIAHYWHFNLVELLFQMGCNVVFCWLLFECNLDPYFQFLSYFERKKYFLYFFYSLLFLLVFTLISGGVQLWLFPVEQVIRLYWLGYFCRLGLGGIFIIILVRIILLLRTAKQQNLENEQLKNAYMTAELELLKEQMNPHFLFNSLSSLSGVIREDPELAQRYVRDLSNVFRYTLTRAKVNLVSLEDELNMLRSFAQLITMRLEAAFELNVDVPDKYLVYKLPHLSLQPLLENAVKHNAATLTRPLKVDIFIQFDKLVVSNTVWEISVPEISNGIGLANLNERFKIMLDDSIEIVKSSDEFIVKLPLKA